MRRAFSCLSLLALACSAIDVAPENTHANDASADAEWLTDAAPQEDLGDAGMWGVRRSHGTSPPLSLWPRIAREEAPPREPPIVTDPPASAATSVSVGPIEDWGATLSQWEAFRARPPSRSNGPLPDGLPRVHTLARGEVMQIRVRVRACLDDWHLSLHVDGSRPDLPRIRDGWEVRRVRLDVGAREALDTWLEGMRSTPGEPDSSHPTDLEVLHWRGNELVHYERFARAGGYRVEGADHPWTVISRAPSVPRSARP
jgi:hypothetical protein